LVTLISYANKNISTFGYDPDKNQLRKTNLGKFSIEEPSLLKTFNNKRSYISLSHDYSVLNKCDIIYFSFDIETDKFGFSDTEKCTILIKKLVKIIRPNQILVILSQVSPGFTRMISELHPNTYYQVETLVFGNALYRAENPERIIVGTKKDNKIDTKYKNLLSVFNCPILVMDYESAEFTKITINMYLTNDVVLTNALSQIVIRYGGNWEYVKTALKMDRRIGNFAYLNPGLGISGGNLERDIRTWESMSGPNDQVFDLLKIFKRNSNKQKKWFILEIVGILSVNDYKISILGLAYKENTNSLKNSISVNIYKKFKKNIVSLYDPLVKEFSFTKKELLAASILECISAGDLLIILNPSFEFYGIEKLINKSSVKVVMDPHRILNPDLLNIEKYISCYEIRNNNE
jgi:UDPglucose 6-dehydrogenase